MGLSLLVSGVGASSYQNINAPNLSAWRMRRQVAGSCGGGAPGITGKTAAARNLWPVLCPWFSWDPSEKTGSDHAVN